METLLKPWSCTPICETCDAMYFTVPHLPISRKRSSPIASNWRSAEPYWKPCVHSVQPIEVYLPFTVNTGVPCSGFQDFSMLRIFCPDNSNTRSICDTSFLGVSLESILMAMSIFGSSRRKEAQTSFPVSVKDSSRRLLQSAKVKPSVHVDDFAGAKRKGIARNRGNGATHILRRAPTLDGR